MIRSAQQKANLEVEESSNCHQELPVKYAVKSIKNYSGIVVRTIDRILKAQGTSTRAT